MTTMETGSYGSYTSVARILLTFNNPKLLLLEQPSSNLAYLRPLHAHMIRTHLIEDTFTVSRLIAFCTDPGHSPTLLHYARRVFSQIQNPNTFIYNAMIRAYSASDNPQQSIHLYNQLQCRCLRPDNLTFPFLLKSSTHFASLEMGMQINGQIIRYGFESDVYVQNSLVHMYAASGDLQTAERIFYRISHLDIVSWTSMIGGYNRCGDVRSARQLFDRMPQRNVVTWSIMIRGYARNGHFDQAVNLFRVMKAENVRANETVMVSVISSCAHLGALEQGRRAHDYVVKNNLAVNLILGTALVDMYARCGDSRKAIEVFEQLTERDVLCWTTVIAGLAMHGHAEMSLEYFTRMVETGVMPRDVTFTAVLSACSHGGLVERGFKLFESMREDYKIEPRLEHYGCMVDLLGRAGKLDEAERFIHQLPLKPNAPIWGALLGACRIHRNVEIGERVGKILIELEPGHSGYYVLLSNVYARANRWDQVTELRQNMKDRGVKKSPGYSLIEVDGIVHRFIMGDGSHPEIEQIRAMWEEIALRIRAVGYMGNKSDVLFDIDEEEKESALYQHSEKLAIAFGMMRTGNQTVIRIVKNLRVCDDCHTATKFISKVFDRELIVRDRNRFHHFRQGECSCLDYW
ncbi:pentatricopeptide repeat-containing protein At5g06540 [Magnolia sinica]|uniref:pentatricopeptide repeat-containing protein At5g06540 n=1 Tax=Magnolia sinica TaxID=86752 RepID=UPI002659DDFB|nr:pentatricopeptide repeat-containing protein At5g06540 [Magnolia sinica]